MTSGILSPLTSLVEGMKKTNEDVKHYVTPKGSSSIVKHFVDKASCNVKLNHHLSRIDYVDGKWRAKTLGGNEDDFDIVVLTMPVPQILGLSGTVKEIICKFHLFIKIFLYF